MSFESFSSSIADDGQPNTALDIAGQAVRDFNHRSFTHMDLDRPGWRFAPDAYRSLGELRYLVGGLPQAFEQLAAALSHQLDQDLICMDAAAGLRASPS
jgi:hypothetical protein